MPEFLPGDVFGDLRVEGLAGRGGMGVVYRATQLRLERTVALKVINPLLAEEEDFRHRFVAESKAAASIEHPNVVPIYHAGERDAVLYIVMRYIDGPDLRALVRAQGRLDGERAAQIVAQVGDALDAAHADGLVHRDVKPANVLLDHTDRAYLTDFGLTKRAATTAGGELSRAGGWVGTLGYVAPEQIRGERVDARADVYALGCVLLHALTGSPPYARDSDEATLWAHLNAPPPTDDVPPRLRGVIARALAKDPSERYPSAGDLGRAALTAAGRDVPDVAERRVARGAAAPPSDDTPVVVASASASAVPVAAAAADAETRPSPEASAGAGRATIARRDPVDPAPAPAAGRRRRRGALAGAGACALVAIALAAAVLHDDGGDRPPPSPTATGAPRADTGRRASVPDPPLRGVGAPLSVTRAGANVWFSGRSRRLHIHDARSAGGIRRGPLVGAGTHAIAALRGSVWVLNTSTNRLVEINSRTEQRVPGRTIDLAVAGRAVAVTAGAGAVWAVVRNRGGARRNEYVVRIDPDDAERTPYLVPAGAQDVAVDGRWLWVTNRATPTVTRISVATRRVTDVIPAGRDPRGVAVGEDAVWIASAGEDAVTRINPRTLRRTGAIPLKARPDRVVAGGGSVWVTSRAAARLVRINPRTRRILEHIPTAYDPFALAIAPGNSVWLTLVREKAVQRVRFFR